MIDLKTDPEIEYSPLSGSPALKKGNSEVYLPVGQIFPAQDRGKVRIKNLGTRWLVFTMVRVDTTPLAGGIATVQDYKVDPQNTVDVGAPSRDYWANTWPAPTSEQHWELREFAWSDVDPQPGAPGGKTPGEMGWAEFNSWLDKNKWVIVGLVAGAVAVALIYVYLTHRWAGGAGGAGGTVQKVKYGKQKTLNITKVPKGAKPPVEVAVTEMPETVPETVPEVAVTEPITEPVDTSREERVMDGIAQVWDARMDAVEPSKIKVKPKVKI